MAHAILSYSNEEGNFLKATSAIVLNSKMCDSSISTLKSKYIKLTLYIPTKKLRYFV